MFSEIRESSRNPGKIVEPAALPILEPPKGTDLQIDPSLEKAALETINDVFRLTFKSPIIHAVKHTTDLKTQKFFIQHDIDLEQGRAKKPMFFSSTHQQLVISLPDMRMFLKSYEEAWEENPQGVLEETRNFAINRIEFGLHEYGHIAAFNKAIVVRESAVSELREMRKELVKMLQSWPNPEIGHQRIPHVLSDLRAEVFRLFTKLDDESLRDKTSFSRTGVEERVLEGGVLRCPTIYPDSILRMLAWYPVCKMAGPDTYADKVLESAYEAATLYSSGLEPLVTLAVEYFDLYFTSRCYDEKKLLSKLE